MATIDSPVGGRPPAATIDRLVGARPTTAAPVDPNIPLSGTNKSILKGLGLDLDTVLTPKGKRKKAAGLVGQDPAELASMLGE